MDVERGVDRGRQTAKGGNWAVIAVAVVVIGAITVGMHVTVRLCCDAFFSISIAPDGVASF